MLKILFCTYWGIPHSDGINTYLNLLKKELEQRGHQVDILAHHPDMQQIYMLKHRSKNLFVRELSGWSVNKPKIKNVIYDEVYRYYQKYLPHVHPWIRWREIERYTFELAVSLFDLHQYDVIHSHDVIATRAMRRVKPNHVPLVFQNHGLLAQQKQIAGEIANKNSLKWKYVVAEEYYGAMSCDQTILPSNLMQRELIESYGVPTEQCKVIPYGMDLEPFLEWLQYQPYPSVEKKSNEVVIACPARLVPEKGQKTLIEALALMKQKRSDFVCWFIGDGPLRYELERDCAERGVADHVVFMGHRADVASLLGKTDIVILPSLDENLPYAIMEAQVAGKAIIASDAGAIQEMIRHGETGLIFEAGNGVQLAERLLEAIGYPDLRQHLETNAREWGTQQWSSKVLCDRVLNLYGQVMKSVKSPKVQNEKAKTTVMQKDSAASIFTFRVQSQLSAEEWGEIVNRLPASYSIPDLAFLKVLTETNRFDE